MITSTFDKRIDTLLMSAGLIKSLLKWQSILRLSPAFVHVSTEKYPVDSESLWKSKNIFFWIISEMVDDVYVIVDEGWEVWTVQYGSGINLCEPVF